MFMADFTGCFDNQEFVADHCNGLGKWPGNLDLREMIELRRFNETDPDAVTLNLMCPQSLEGRQQFSLIHMNGNSPLQRDIKILLRAVINDSIFQLTTCLLIPLWEKLNKEKISYQTLPLMCFLT